MHAYWARLASRLRPSLRGRDVTAVILDRPRHADIIRECREAGVRIRLISDGDVGAAIEVAKEGTPVDILLGIGGTPEGAAPPAAAPALVGSTAGLSCAASGAA